MKDWEKIIWIALIAVIINLVALGIDYAFPGSNSWNSIMSLLIAALIVEIYIVRKKRK